MIYDFAIIGGGMAGASVAAELAGSARVLLLEGEAQPGYHATGRSAAFWDESYGGPGVQPLTTASGPYLSDHGLLAPRGALYIARAGDAAKLDRFVAAFAGSSVRFVRQDAAQIAARVPGIRPEWCHGVHLPDCTDIDVAALHGHYLARARRGGAHIQTAALVTGLSRSGGQWTLTTAKERFVAATIVNAGGAWASAIAAMAGASPIAITPFRRTIVQLRIDPPAPTTLPLVLDIDGSFYFKPDAGGRLWLSPHDETPDIARDVWAEEIDIATAIDQFERVGTWRVDRVDHSWAGLRSFAPDRLPVYGFDDRCPGFFWCAGQGGFGIQTAPAAAMLCAALLTGSSLPPAIAAIDPARFTPDRRALCQPDFA